MSKLRIWLSGLLVLQLLVAAGLYWNSATGEGGAAPSALFAFDADAVDRVVVGDAAHSVTLAKRDGRWVLPERGSLPVDAAQLHSVLAKVGALRAGWPVATTTPAQERFEVADDKFQRRLELFQGDTPVATLLLGTSPGFRQTHIRKAGDDAIYNANLNSYELPTGADGWLDKTLLGAGEVQAIKGGDFSLRRDEGAWAFADAGGSDNAGPGQTPDGAKADALAEALGYLRVLAISDQPLEHADATLTVSSGAQEWTYRFAAADGHYLAARDDIDGVFTISAADYDRITHSDRITLATSAESSETTAQADASHG